MKIGILYGVMNQWGDGELTLAGQNTLSNVWQLQNNSAFVSPKRWVGVLRWGHVVWPSPLELDKQQKGDKISIEENSVRLVASENPSPHTSHAWQFVLQSGWRKISDRTLASVFWKSKRIYCWRCVSSLPIFDVQNALYVCAKKTFDVSI